jgi:hypothetical protein
MTEMAEQTAVPEAWELDSGLRDDMTFSIQGAYFAPHAEYQEGRQLMIWLLGTDENNEPAEVRMSIGADWQSPDGGNTIVHPTKRKQHINKSCIFGHWISHSFEVPDLARELISRGGPTDARIWIGLILQLNLRTLHWGGDIKDQERLMPTALVGLTDSNGNANVATQAAPSTPSVATTSVPVQAAPPAGVDQVFDPQAALAAARAAASTPQIAANASPLFQRAVGLAAGSPDFATFLGQAFADAEILADDELAEQCANEGAGGVWVVAHPS